MASGLPCKDCASGTLHDGTPVGRIETIHGLQTYITDPPDGAKAKGIVVIIPDAFGWTLPNSRVLADRYAERGGWRVMLPDFMDGGLPPSATFWELRGMLTHNARLRPRPKPPRRGACNDQSCHSNAT